MTHVCMDEMNTHTGRFDMREQGHHVSILIFFCCSPNLAVDSKHNNSQPLEALRSLKQDLNTCLTFRRGKRTVEPWQGRPLLS